MQVENREIINEARDRMLEWNAYEWDEQPESVKQYRDILEDFYERNGNNPADSSNFNSRVKLSTDAEEELADIATAFLNDRATDTDYYEEFFSQDRSNWRKRMGIKNMDDLVTWLDRMERYKNDALLSAILDSEQIAELHKEASKKDKKGNVVMSEEKLYETIMDNYKKTGEEDLYNVVWNEIKKKGKKGKKKK